MVGKHTIDQAAATSARTVDQVVEAGKRTADQATEVTRELAERAANAAQQGLQVVLATTGTVHELPREVARRSTEGTAEIGRTLLSLAQEQTRQAGPLHPRQLWHAQVPKGAGLAGRHPRRTSLFTPTSGSWLNAVESFFSALTRRRLRRGVFCSIVELQAAIHRYIDQHNDDPACFIWTKTADQITAKRNRLNTSVQ